MGDLSEILDLVGSMALVLGAAFYVSIVIWTYKDARKRSDDPIMVATFTAVSMLPLFGVFIYMLVRPSEYLADVRERELEIRALERQLGRQERCPYCKSHIEGDYLSCPVCTTKLRQSCGGCSKPLDPRWVLCPYCETEVPGRANERGPQSGGGNQRRATAARPSSPSTTKKDSSKSSSSERGGSSKRPAREEGGIHTEPLDASSSKRSGSSKSTKPTTTKS